MALQLGVTHRNARLDAIETIIGASGFLQFRTGAQPADCAAVDTGTLLCEIALPADYFNPAATGQMTKLGTWSGTGVGGGGVIAHFRMKNNAKTVTGLQGSVGQGSGDCSLDNTTIADGQTLTVTTWTLTDANA
jgi:hypothetical protein